MRGEETGDAWSARGDSPGNMYGEKAPPTPGEAGHCIARYKIQVKGRSSGGRGQSLHEGKV